jgi:hypothetical protein
MDPVGFVVVALLAGGLVVVVRAFAEGPPLLPNLFRHQMPGWPRGVQEDDNVRWTWRPRPRDPSEPIVERLHGRVRAGRGD